MTIKRLLLWSALALVTLGVAAVLLDIPVIVEGYFRHESFFQGKPTTYWKKRLEAQQEDRQIDYQRTLQTLQKGGSAAVPVLVEALKDSNPLVRGGAVQALQRLGPDARNAAPDLEEALKDNDSLVRVRVATTLFQIDPSNTKGVSVLLESLKEPKKVHQEAAETIKKIGREAGNAEMKSTVQALMKALRQKDGLFRVQVADMLYDMNEVATYLVPVLIETLKDQRGDVREKAAIVLGKIGPNARRAVPALIEAARDDQVKVRGWALEALGHIGPDAKSAAPVVREALKDPNPNVKAAAARTLLKITADPGARSGNP